MVICESSNRNHAEKQSNEFTKTKMKHTKNLIAHAPHGKAQSPHLLTDHLQVSAKLAEDFASAFGLNKLSRIVGLCHDLGKASHAFQDRIRLVSGYDIEAHLEGKTPRHVDHSTAGAQYALNKYGPPGIALAYIVAGHHAGLPDGKGDDDASLKKRLKKNVDSYDAILSWLEPKLPEKIFQQDFIPIRRNDRYALQLHFVIRMLFSVLVDADFLDTESYMDPNKRKLRTKKLPDITAIKKHFDSHLATFAAENQTEINIKRAKILKWCKQAAEKEPGIFSLTVPTGGGKTLSSMAFALDHAAKFGHRRIIYVIPYTSIIEQNADVFREIFDKLDKGIILEHHSNFDPKNETVFNRLATENWDTPIVVTTNVQFFQSFYANRTSANRKLHNIANSVIIFDEAQILPPEHLYPCLSIINELTRHYGCSAVICTATQPAVIKSNLIEKGLDGAREIVPDPDELYEDFRRIRIKQIPGQLSHENIAEKLGQYQQALCVVNTRKEARLIYQQLIKLKKEACFHLSTMMCPDHRTKVFTQIKQKLKDGLACIVVSTQLIEAGVDLDFPVVFRAITGIDSIAQASGRCNREGKQEIGDVFVFKGETLPPPGHLRKSADSGLRILSEFNDDPLKLEAVKAYFYDFYSKEKHAHQFDKKSILDMCNSSPDAIPFKQIAREFSLIEEKDFPIIVPFDKTASDIIESLRKSYNGFVSRELRRRIQRISVRLREKPFLALCKAGVIEDVFGDGRFFLLTNKDIYEKNVGLMPDIPAFHEIESLII